MTVGISSPFLRNAGSLQQPNWIINSPIWDSQLMRSTLSGWMLKRVKSKQTDLRRAAAMAYWFVIHSPLCPGFYPRPFHCLKDRDVGWLLEHWPFSFKLLEYFWPADFSALGLPHPHRQQFRLPYAKVVPGHGLCAVVIASSYPLTGSGYMCTHLNDEHLTTSNPEKQNPPWVYHLGTKHSQGKDTKTLSVVRDKGLIVASADFELEIEDFQMLTTVDKEYTTTA